MNWVEETWQFSVKTELEYHSLCDICKNATTRFLK